MQAGIHTGRRIQAYILTYRQADFHIHIYIHTNGGGIHTHIQAYIHIHTNGGGIHTYIQRHTETETATYTYTYI